MVLSVMHTDLCLERHGTRWQRSRCNNVPVLKANANRFAAYTQEIPTKTRAGVGLRPVGPRAAGWHVLHDW